MDPQWWIVGSVLATSAVAGAGFYVGRSTLSDDLRRKDDRIAILERERDEEKARRIEVEASASLRAQGAREDLQRAAGRAAADDFDGVLDAGYGPRADSPAGEQGGANPA